MGNQPSKGKSKGKSTKPTMKDFQALAEITRFTASEIQQLYTRYEKLSNSQIADGMIDVHEFQAALGLSSSGFAQRIFAAFDEDNSKEIDFVEFVKGLSALSPRASLHEKASFCFNVYDIDKNGFIDRDELREVLSFSLGENSSIHLPAAQLEKVIDATFKKMDSNGDGQISIEEFETEASKNPAILQCVNLSIDGLFT